MPKGGQPTSFLSRAECNLMRGFAILVIILNNFTHSLQGVIMDNEYSYCWERVEKFLRYLSHPDGLLPFDVLSFYCPYGVILFIFLSGYGLTLKYEKGSGMGVSRKDFVVSHYNKLFVMQIKGLALYCAFVLLCHIPIDLEGVPLLLQTFLVGNLNPYQSIIPGCYWFFGMILEMYVIFRLLIYQRKDIFIVALVVFSLVVMAVTGPESDVTLYLRTNCFMAILPFCMGVLAARHQDFKFVSLHKGVACLGWLVLSFILLTLSKFNFFVWLILPVFVIGTGVAVVKLIGRVGVLDGVFGWLGAMSGVLFVVHSAVRDIVLMNDKLSEDCYSALAFYLVITFGLCIILKPAFSSKKQ